MNTPKNKASRTVLVHGGTRRSSYNEVSEALYLTQGFVYETAEQAEQRFLNSGPDEFIYARYGNPTVAMFEDRLAAYEGAEAAFATASGMAAINGVLMAGIKAGDHIVSARALFGSCLHILENILMPIGVEVSFVDGTDLAQWRAAVRAGTKYCFVETISNPTLEVADIASIAEIAHHAGAKLVVDNVFATPVFSDVLGLGADILIYSSTKHIDGQGRCLGGVVLGREDYIRGDFMTYMKHTGGAMSPFNAWVMLKGLETLELRCNAQARSALAIAKALEGHEKLEEVIHPGLPSHPQHELTSAFMTKPGTMMALRVKNGKEGAFRFLNALTIPVISNNLGDAKTIVTHPATTTHQRLPEDQKQSLGISENLVRVSIGLEDQDDLIADFIRALDSV